MWRDKNIGGGGGGGGVDLIQLLAQRAFVQGKGSLVVEVRLYWGGCAAGCFCLGLQSSMLKLENGFLLKLLWHDLTMIHECMDFTSEGQCICRSVWKCGGLWGRRFR